MGGPDETSAHGPAGFGAELRRLRGARGLSLTALAQRIHYSKGYLSKIENGGKPPTPDLARRCDEELLAGGALARLVPEVPPARTPEADDPRNAVCPYPGLAAFRPQDARWFFGRDRATAQLLEQLAGRIGGGPLAVIAPSGAGKSSLLRAGLVPALERGALPVAGSRGWPVVVCTPTPNPLKELLRCVTEALGTGLSVTPEELEEGPGRLAEILRPVLGTARLVLLVDQFEETFTLCADEAERHAFVSVLCSVSRAASGCGEPPATVVLGMRADFCGRCLEHEELAAVLTHGLFALGPMTAAELREAVVRPAERAGLALEPGLVELLLRDLEVRGASRGTASGALPLLSHALLVTWQQRSGRTLTVHGYEMTGGIHGAIARSAEEVFGRLQPAEQDLARRILVRLVHVGDGDVESRRRADRDPLLAQLPDRRAAEATLDAFVRARLLTVDRDAVEITHEALLRAWPRLRGWIDNDRAGLLTHQQLAQAAGEWVRERRDPGLLHRGNRLAVAREWAEQTDGRAELGPHETEFLDASLAEERSRRTAARRQATVQRRLLVTLAALLVVAVLAGSLAFQQRSRAVDERRVAQSQEMAVRSGALATGQPEASILLAAAAYRTAPTTEARGALLSTQSQYFAGRLRGHTGPVNAVAFSPDGRLLASASSDGTVRLWSVADHRTVAALTGNGAPVRSVAFSPDGRLLASAGSDGTVRLWGVADHRAAGTLTGHSGGVRAVAFAPDGATLASGGADGTVRIWDVAGRRLLTTLTGHTDQVLSVAFAPDGKTLASSSADRTIRLWDAVGRQPLTTLTGHNDEVLSVAFAPDGKTLASGSADRTVRIWDVAEQRPLATLTGHNDDINAVAFSREGTAVISTSGDGTAKLWDTATHRVTATLAGHTDYVLSIAVGPGNLLATAGFDQSVVLWDLGRSALTTRPFAELWQSAFSPDGRLLASAGADRTVKLWDVTHRRRLADLTGHDGSVFAVAFSPDGRLLASAGADRTVKLWDVARHRLVTDLTGHDGSVFAVAFSPDGRLLASAGADRTVKLWDVARHRLVTDLTGHQDFVNTVAFSPDGRTLASGSDDLTVRLWDVAGRRAGAVLRGHSGSVRGVSFSPDGRTLASGGNDGTVRLWDPSGPGADGRTAGLSGHSGAVRAVAFSPDGRTLAGSGSDGTVRLWDTGGWRLTATLTGHSGAVWGVAFDPRQPMLASSSNDGTVRLWNVDVRQRGAEICRLAGGAGRTRWAQLLPGVPYRPVCPS
ncbi:helix-turn-helix domain-containing protein [Streptomyces sp. SID13666]|uniref:nSTAND1 domain-containing NTPase n=1 Tax=Streptomyces sp. SID13666 TaxID=2706054 RepID=UPI0013C226E3|nr:helix-turn-helix domain-containing protein [Streptomyces sp. SID13666]NEA57206.1 helix-turn-helix domain-containing protein [Streptomyces sp. SID13666]